MSSALAMVLMAGMAVPGIGPEMVSAEVEQRLDLRGMWEGTRWNDKKVSCYVCYKSGWLASPFEIAAWVFELSDEGRGNVKIKSDKGDFLGIYQQDGNRTVICYRAESKGRPISFWAGDGQHLLILRRVKPGK
jgi:hypothetical protein